MLRFDGDIYQDFIKHLKSDRTKDLYKRALEDYCNYLKVSNLEDLLKLKNIEKSIIGYLDYLNDKHFSYSQINIARSSLNYFYMRNDILNLNWKKISHSLPEHTKPRQDRPYTHEEIRKMINIAPLVAKAIILLLASSGIRIGAISDLNKGDLKQVENLYEIRVYRDSVKYNYTTYCSPECKFYIDEYLKDRIHDNEKIIDSSPLFRREYDRTKADKNVERLDYGGLKSILRRLRFRAGVVEKSDKSRYETSLGNAFRKFHYNMLSEAAVRPNIIDKLSQVSYLMSSYDLLNVLSRYSDIAAFCSSIFS